MIAPLIALFVGGLVVSRLAPSPSRASRAIQAGIMWAVATLAAVFAITVVASSIVSGAVQKTGEVASAVTGMAADGASAIDKDTLTSMGLDSDAIIAPVNARLRATGKPEVTAAQLQSAAKDALVQAVQTGKLDRQMLVKTLSANTTLTTEDTNEIATAVESRWNTFRDRASALAERAKTGALQAAEMTGKALLGLSLALLFGLGAAIGGALLTGQHDRRRF